MKLAKMLFAFTYKIVYGFFVIIKAVFGQVKNSIKTQFYKSAQRLKMKGKEIIIITGSCLKYLTRTTPLYTCQLILIDFR